MTDPAGRTRSLARRFADEGSARDFYQRCTAAHRQKALREGTAYCVSMLLMDRDRGGSPVEVKERTRTG